MGQTVIMGVIFLLVFSAYYMLQGYASILFGTELASNALVCLYAVFTIGCFVAPGIVNYFGGKRSLAAGVIGYGFFSLAAFVYAILNEATWTKTLVVVCGGCRCRCRWCWWRRWGRRARKWRWSGHSACR